MHVSVWLVSMLLIADAPAPTDPEAARPGPAPLDSFRATMDEAGEQLTLAIDAAAETVRKRRNITTDERLAALNELQRQRDLFEQQSVVPNSTVLQSAATRYRRTMEQAATRLDRALKPVIDELVKNGRPEEANRLLSERNLLVVGPGHELVGRWRLQEGAGATDTANGS